MSTTNTDNNINSNNDNSKSTNVAKECISSVFSLTKKFTSFHILQPIMTAMRVRPLFGIRSKFAMDKSPIMESGCLLLRFSVATLPFASSDCSNRKPPSTSDRLFYVLGKHLILSESRHVDWGRTLRPEMCLVGSCTQRPIDILIEMNSEFDRFIDY